MVERERLSELSKRAGDSLRTDISLGIYVGLLPSMTILGEKYGVSRVTMRNAMKYLETEGLLIIKQGRGTSVNVPKGPQEVGGGNFITELPDTFNEAVGHYVQFLANYKIPREVKVRMIGIIDAQIGLVEHSQQPNNQSQIEEYG